MLPDGSNSVQDGKVDLLANSRGFRRVAVT